MEEKIFVVALIIIFGLGIFGANELYPCFNNELSDWWNGEMRPKFQKLIEKK